MNKEISIAKNTCILKLISELKFNEFDGIIFTISKSSSFTLFSEGIALGLIQDLEEANKKIVIRLHNSTTKLITTDLKSTDPNNYSALTDLNIPEILCGIFGLQLLYKSTGAENFFSDTNDSVLARKLIGTIIWKTVQARNGRLGDGKNQYLISRHDYRIPSLLRDGDPLRFPLSDVFRAKISPIIGSIGKEKISSIDAKTLVESWIYHIAENMFEHGSVDVSNNENLIEGYSGILIQKIATPNMNSIENRSDLDEKTKSYIQNLYQDHEFKNTDTLTVITVMDSGRGIHNTLPKEHTNTPAGTRLNAAFMRGVTRNRIGKKRSGYGLFDSVRAARKLKACLVVCSSEIYTTKTFEQLDGNNIDFNNNSKIINKKNGTSQSIIWPSNSTNKG